MADMSILEFTGLDIAHEPDVSYDKLLVECLSIKHTSRIVGNYTAAANSAKSAAECYRRLGDPDNAIKEYDFALDIYSEENNVHGIAWTTWAKANIFRYLGNYNDSLKSLQLAYQIASESENEDCAIYSLSGIAETTRILGNYSVSIPQHRFAYDKFRKKMISVESFGRMKAWHKCTK
jgi:tetratricopeptide (TPR) repeat protein